MPFTIAHAAAALPLNRLAKARLPMAALMIGAMSPDFAYFLPVEIARDSTHDLAGIFRFCWPAGLFAWFVHVLLLERPTIALLPDAWRTRIAPTRAITLPLVAWASLAIMLGAGTHIVWDAFTHASSPVVDALPTLAEMRVDVGGRNMPLYRMLQYLSSVLGLAALAWWALRLRRLPLLEHTEIVPGVSVRMRVAAVALVVISTIALGIFYAVENPEYGWRGQFYFLLIGGMTGGALAWCAVAVWIRCWYRDGLTATAR